MRTLYTLLDDQRLNHRVEVVPGLLAAEGAALSAVLLLAPAAAGGAHTVKRPTALALAAAALAALAGAGGCGSVTAKRSDGGGTGGSHADSSTKADVPSDPAAAEDARRDAAARKDAVLSTDVRMTDARASDGSRRDAPAAETGGGECQSDADCMLYPGLGSGCCGVCQAKINPAPGTMECLIGCLTPYKSCPCVNHTCIGSKSLL